MIQKEFYHVIYSDGRYVDELGTRAPSSNFKFDKWKNDWGKKHNIYMNGREVFKHAVTRFPEVIKKV